MANSRALQVIVGIALAAYGLSCFAGLLHGIHRFGVLGSLRVQGPLAWLVTFGLPYRGVLIAGAFGSGVGYLGMLLSGAALVLQRRALVPSAVSMLAAWALLELLSIPGDVAMAFGGARLTGPAQGTILQFATPSLVRLTRLVAAGTGFLTAVIIVALSLWLRRAQRVWPGAHGND